jgi:hypothetical protein
MHFFCRDPPAEFVSIVVRFRRLQPLVTMAIRTLIHARSRHVRRRHGQIWSRASLLVHPTTLRELERFPSTQYRPGWTTFHAAPKNPLTGARTTVWIYGLQTMWEAVRGSSVRSPLRSRHGPADSQTLDRYPCSSGVGGAPLRRRRHS